MATLMVILSYLNLIMLFQSDKPLFMRFTVPIMFIGTNALILKCDLMSLRLQLKN